jgi:hypothetical protein
MQCQSQGPTQPKAPKEQYLYSDMQIQNEKHISAVNLPLEMPLTELEKQINHQLEGLIYEDNSYEDNDQDNLKVKVWKTSPIKVQALDSLFLFEVPIKVWVSVGYKVSPLGITLSGYKETEFSMRIRLMSKIHVTPDWKLVTSTVVDSYDWVTEPIIKVAGISIPVKSMVSRTLNRNSDKITGAIDQQVGETIELKKYVLQAWNLARQPVQLSQDFNTWLVVVPTEVMMTPLLAKNNFLRATLGIKGYTQTITSHEKPIPGGATGLPPLKIVEKMPGEFRVGLISQITYPEATRLAEEKFVGQKFTFSGGSYAVEVTSIAIFGQNEYLVIKAGLKGSINGIIYLKGIPTYDPVTKNLSLRKLDYDLDTRNVIFKTASWLLQSRFSKMMEEQFVFPVGDQIAEAQKTIQSALNHNTLTKGIVLSGTLKEIIPDQVYLTPDHINSVVFATGRATLRVEGIL